jgi:eukaryotic-like serine/threonine-protein kinase
MRAPAVAKPLADRRSFSGGRPEGAPGKDLTVIGQRLGPYEVLSKLGEGGMGEVYRARDTRLDRDVALKILPESFAGDADRLMRFEREAKTLASLNHPHIAQIYGIEEGTRHGGAHAANAGLGFGGHVRALVMELVEGEDLSTRIAHGPMPLDDTLPIARQIAAALGAAHEAGIIHRDLKPANIKVRRDGTIKVLDFGLAKGAVADRQEGPQSPTVTSPALTQAGVILGTAAYMSPEQARGRPVDKRADIWAFGCVLYEMLTGRPAFEGDTVTDLLGAIVKSDPDWSALPADTPPELQRLLRRCLQKDAAKRLRDMADAQLDIEDASEALSRPVPPTADIPPARRGILPVPLLVLLALALGVAAGAWWRNTGTETAHWRATELGGPRLAFQPHLSPDGRMLAFLALVGHQSQLAVMTTETGDWSLLTSQSAIGPITTLAWSADSSRIYFDRSRAMGREIYSVSPLGGEPRLVLENASIPQPLPDGSLLFLRPDERGLNQLHRYWPDTTRVSSFPVAVHTSFVASLRAFRDGREAVAYGRVLTADVVGPYQLLVVDLETGATRELPYAADQAQSFSGSEGVVPLSVTADDRHVLTTVREGSSSSVISIARTGAAERRFLFTTTRLVTALSQSSTGAIYLDQVDRTIEHLRFPPGGGAPERLASGLPSVNATGALMLPDGRSIYATVIAGRQRLVTGRRGEELVPFVDTQDEARGPLARVNDREFIFVGGTRDSPVLTVASAETGRVLRRLEDTRGRHIGRLTVSPDGSTLYFVSLDEIWTMPVAGGEPRVITRGGGVALDPRDGTMFIERRDMERVSIVRRDHAGTETPLSWPADPRPTGLSLWPRAVSPSGRLLVVAESDDSWFWGPAVYDLNTLRVYRVPLDYAGDLEVDLAWDGDHIAVLARRLESAMWRFDLVP